MTSAMQGRDAQARAVVALLDRARLALERALGRAQAAGVLARLTPREYQIVTLAALRRSNREIAATLFLSHRTVGYHLSMAYPKLGVSSRAELATLIAGQAW